MRWVYSRTISLASAALIATSALAAPARETRKPTDYNEWNIPKDLYVPGDPFLLTKDNMMSGRRINFVSCPILMDSDPTPLWFTDYEGKRYFLRAQQNTTADVHHPQLGHRILVEGIVSNDKPIAGGIVLNPLRISVMRELDSNCKTKLPARPGYKVDFAKRPPGPGTSGRSRETVNTTYYAAGLDTPNYVPKPVKRERREFLVQYDFDNHLTWEYRNVTNAIEFAKNLRASKISIVGEEGPVLLSNGQVLHEQAGISKTRAEKVAAIFADYGLKNNVAVSWETAADAPNGLSDFLRRVVKIVVEP